MKLNFPSVTICNQNVVHCGNLKATILDCSDDSGAYTNASSSCIYSSNDFALAVQIDSDQCQDAVPQMSKEQKAI